MSLEEFKKSRAWDSTHNLPLCPDFNNPWIYAAYAFKLAGGLTEFSTRAAIKAYADACRIRFGLLNRYPSGRGPTTSHDELIGMAYLSPDLARELVLYLSETDGLYCNKPEEIKNAVHNETDFNMYRFYWLLPYLKSRALGFRVGAFGQILYCAFLIIDALTAKPVSMPVAPKGAPVSADAGGRLRIWLMNESMEKLFLCSYAVRYWRARMRKLGDNPKAAFMGELASIPEYADLAPIDF